MYACVRPSIFEHPVVGVQTEVYLLVQVRLQCSLWIYNVCLDGYPVVGVGMLVRSARAGPLLIGHPVVGVQTEVYLLVQVRCYSNTRL